MNYLYNYYLYSDKSLIFMQEKKRAAFRDENHFCYIYLIFFIMKELITLYKLGNMDVK